MIAGASSGVVMFGAGLFVLAITKIVFDVGLGSWIADHVPYERRGRVVGVTETAWALGLLIGVSLMGLITAATSWRWGYAAAAVAVVVMAGVLAVRIDSGARDSAAPAAVVDPSARLGLPGWLAVLGMFCLMSATQALFVTFGPWLEDEFDVRTVGLAAVTFGLGALELAASTTSAARTDRWGKELSVVGGAAVMVPAALALAALDSHLAIGLLLLGLFIAAFEFAIVSCIPIGGDLIPGSPARGLEHDDRLRHARTGADGDPGDPALRPLGTHARRAARRRLRGRGRGGDVRPPPRPPIGRTRIQPRYPFVIGSRRSRPNAFVVTRTPGGDWRRLYSAMSTSRVTRLTTASSWPSSMISAAVRSSST